MSERKPFMEWIEDASRNEKEEEERQTEDMFVSNEGAHSVSISIDPDIPFVLFYLSRSLNEKKGDKFSFYLSLLLRQCVEMKRIFGTVALIQHGHTLHGMCGKVRYFSKIKSCFQKTLGCFIIDDNRSISSWRAHLVIDKNDLTITTRLIHLLYRAHCNRFRYTNSHYAISFALNHISLPMQFSSEFQYRQRGEQIKLMRKRTPSEPEFNKEIIIISITIATVVQPRHQQQQQYAK